MLVLLRTDSSARIGAGHAMRCLTLAEALRRRGATVCFACREVEGNVISVVEEKGIPVFRQQGGDPRAGVEELFPDWREDAEATRRAAQQLGRVDWLIVDHYGLDSRWEECMRGCAPRILAIDDLANRRHDCDVLLDQNYYVDGPVRYGSLVPGPCVMLLGPGYALLRPDFLSARRTLPARNGAVRRILIFFGGSDPGGLTEKAIAALSSLDRGDIRIDVVVGSGNPDRSRIQRLCEGDPRFYYHCQIGNMAEFMAAADLALGAGGATTWERCFLGLPTITVALAENQIKTTVDLSRAGACRYLGPASAVTTTRLREEVERAIGDARQLRAMSEASMRIAGQNAVLGTDLVAGVLARDFSPTGAAAHG